jgi:hypothetical protein
VNADECRCALVADSGHTRFIVLAEDKTSHHWSARTKQTFSFVPFVSAAGEMLMMFVVIGVGKGKKDGDIDEVIELPWHNDTRNDYPRYYAFNETGYMNNALWEACVKKFTERWNQQNPGLHCALFADRLGSHMQPEVVLWCEKCGVHLILLPPHTSHFLQALDNLPFATVKSILMCLRNVIAFGPDLQMLSRHNPLLARAYEVEKEAFTKQIISGGWQNVGLYPFNIDLLRERMLANVGKQSPPALLASSAKTQELFTTVEKVAEEYFHTEQPRVLHVTAEKNKIITGEQLLEAHAKKEKEKADLKTAKEAKAAHKRQAKALREQRKYAKLHPVANLPRVGRQRRVTEGDGIQYWECRYCYRLIPADNPGWVGCSYCRSYWVCGQCYEPYELVSAHEQAYHPDKVPQNQ